MELENKDFCAKCGGKCCKNLPGSCSVEDFKDEKGIVKALNTGRYCIDWWEGDSTGGDRMETYFIRPSVKGEEGRLFHPTWGGTGCTFLTENGCELELEQRPLECQLLIPMEDNEECFLLKEFSKKEASIEWLKYEYLFEKLKETSNETN